MAADCQSERADHGLLSDFFYVTAIVFELDFDEHDAYLEAFQEALSCYCVSNLERKSLTTEDFAECCIPRH